MPLELYECVCQRNAATATWCMCDSDFLEVAMEGVSASLAQQLEPSSIMLSSERDGTS